jgi:hypothetical protein
LYLIFSSRIVKLKMKVTVFAAIIGKSPVNRPYTNQKKMPVVKVTYMTSEISRVCLVFIIRMACGKNAIVVNVAAIKPNAVDSSIVLACPMCRFIEKFLVYRYASISSGVSYFEIRDFL